MSKIHDSGNHFQKGHNSGNHFHKGHNSGNHFQKGHAGTEPRTQAVEYHFQNGQMQTDGVITVPKNMSEAGRLSSRKWSKDKIFTTACLFMEMIVWGMYIGVMNSSMLDLELVTHSSTAQISFIWTATTVSGGFMAPVAGILLDKSDSRLYLGLAQLGSGVLIGCLPLAKTFTQIIVIAACLGLFLGLLDIGRNITAVKLWGWDGAKWLQFYHFIFAAGSAVSPLFTRPFLAMPLEYSNGNHSLPDIHSNMTMESNTHNSSSISSDVMSESRIHVPFTIVGGAGLLSGCFSLVAFTILRRLKEEEKKPQRERLKLQMRKQNQCYVVTMVILLFLRFFFSVGIEVTLGALQLTFLVKGLGWGKSDAVMAVFTLRVTFAATRGLGVGLATVLTPTKMMFLDIALLFCSFSLLWISSLYPGTSWIIWLSTGLAGVGIATFYSASMSWTEKYLQISGRLGAFFLLGSCAGVLVFPPVGGYLFERFSPWSFVYICFSTTILLLIITIASTIVGQSYQKRHPNETNIELPDLTSI